MNQIAKLDDTRRAFVSNLTHDLILCTKDRPDDVARCLIEVLRSSTLPQNLIVVDASGDQRTCGVVNSMKDDFERLGCTVVYASFKPGLTAQRNLGLDLANSNVSHFIDDDSLVDREYFAEILRVFADLGDRVAGVGGIQSNANFKAPLVRRIFLLSAAPGQISKAACNAFVSPRAKDLTPAAWLTGCAMSFWTEMAKRERFDEALEGYALGEDFEFSLRMAGHGSLLIQPSAKVVHQRSDDNRLDLRRLRRADVTNRWYFVRKHHMRFSRVAYAWSIVGLLCIGLAKVSSGRFEEGRNELLGVRDGLLEVKPLLSARCE
jgi:GT2 family glycosyltransferase